MRGSQASDLIIVVSSWRRASAAAESTRSSARVNDRYAPPDCAKSRTVSSVARTVPFSDARAHLTELLDEIEEIREHIVITRNGRPAAVVMSEAEYESLIETLEVLGDPEVIAALKESDEAR